MNNIIHQIKGYLGYEVELEIPEKIQTDWDGWEIKTLDDFVDADMYTFMWLLKQGDIKLKLRPLESLTKQEMVKVNNIIMYNSMGARLKDWKNAQFIDGLTLKKHLIYIEKDGYLGKNGLFDELVDYFCELHIDYQDLIGQGLAVSNVQNMHKGE